MTRPRKPRPEPSDRPITRELLAAIADDGRTSYALARDAGLDEAAVRRFISRERTLTLDSADRLAVALGLRLIRAAKGRRPPRPAATADRPADGHGHGDGPGDADGEESPG